MSLRSAANRGNPHEQGIVTQQRAAGTAKSWQLPWRFLCLVCRCWWFRVNGVLKLVSDSDHLQNQLLGPPKW